MNYDLLSQEGTAVSPFDQWPGSVTMPQWWNVTIRKRWWSWFKDVLSLEEEDERGKPVIAFSENEEGSPTYTAYLPYWFELVEMFGEIDIPSLNKIDKEDWPEPIFVWVCDVGREWHDRHSSFQRGGVANMAKQTKHKQDKSSSG